MRRLPPPAPGWRNAGKPVVQLVGGVRQLDRQNRTPGEALDLHEAEKLLPSAADVVGTFVLVVSHEAGADAHRLGLAAYREEDHVPDPLDKTAFPDQPLPINIGGVLAQEARACKQVGKVGLQNAGMLSLERLAVVAHPEHHAALGKACRQQAQPCPEGKHLVGREQDLIPCAGAHPLYKLILYRLFDCDSCALFGSGGLVLTKGSEL
jgi:hypothetical protein